MSQPFDVDKALKALQNGQALAGKAALNHADQAVNRSALAAELDSHPTWSVEAKVRQEKWSKRQPVLLSWPL